MWDKITRFFKPSKAVHQPFFRYEKTVEQLPGYVDIFGNEVPDADKQFYPPKLHGISVFSVESIAKRYAEALDKLADDVKIGSHRIDESGTPLFEARYLTVIMRFIEYVHMLPASENQHHSQAGGMLRHSLETAHTAMLEADEHRPPTTRYIDDDERRRPRYIYAAWIAGLLHDTGKLFSDMQVTALSIYDDKTKTEAPAKNVYKDAPVWQPHVESLVAWAKRHQVLRYSVEYKKNRKYKEHDQNSAILLPKLLQGEGLNYILESPDDLYAHLNNTLSGYMDSNDYLARMVRNADAYSTGKDVLKISESVFGERAKSLVMLISEQMRTARADWTFNRTHGHAWVIGGEVFLRWSNAFNSITATANANNIDRLPQKARRLLSMMEDNRIVEPYMPESRSIMFAAGEYTADDVKRILNNELSVHWEELIKLTWSGHLFGGDPLPSNGSGLIMIPKENNEHEFLHAYSNGSIVPLEIELPEQNESSQADESDGAESKSTTVELESPSDNDTKKTSDKESSKSVSDDKDATQSSSDNKSDSKRQQDTDVKPKKKKSNASVGLTFINDSNSDDDNEASTSESDIQLDGQTDAESVNKPEADENHGTDSTSQADSESESEVPDTLSSQSEEDNEPEADSPDDSFPAVVLAVRESGAYLSTDKRGVHTVDAERLGDHLNLSPEQVAELALQEGVLKRDYSSSTLEQYTLINNEQRVTLQLKRQSATPEELMQSSSDNDSNNKDATESTGASSKRTKKPVKKQSKKNQKKTPSADTSTESNNDIEPEEPLSSDNGFRLFAHRSEPGTLGHLLNELVVENDMTSLITETQGSVRFIANRLEEAISAKSLPGYQQVTSSNIFDACHKVIGDDIEAEFNPQEGTFITVPLSYLERVRLKNVIK